MSREYETVCKCGAVHVAPLGSGASSGFGLSFQSGEHTLVTSGRSIYRKKRKQSKVRKESK